ncbi:MAG: hypothetical protein IBJ00_02345, partial [Alphaproteobacteria bacterium]|nr:hypothetical protein [Alphaproteobacteria bacterium]
MIFFINFLLFTLFILYSSFSKASQSIFEEEQASIPSISNSSLKIYYSPTKSLSKDPPNGCEADYGIIDYYVQLMLQAQSPDEANKVIAPLPEELKHSIFNKLEANNQVSQNGKTFLLPLPSSEPREASSSATNNASVSSQQSSQDASAADSFLSEEQIDSLLSVLPEGEAVSLG